MSRSMVLEDTQASPPDEFWTTPEMYNVEKNQPVFSRRVVAEVFFGKSYEWMFKSLRKKLFFNGQRYIPHLTQADNGYYEFKLYDIELVANVFAESEIIDVSQLERTLLIVKTVAQNYRYL